MPRISDRQRRVGHVTQIRDLAVRFGRRRYELVPEAEIDSHVRPQPNVVLREEAPERLPIVADGIDLSGHCEIHIRWLALQKGGEVWERDNAAALARRVLIELNVLSLKSESRRMLAACQKDRVGDLKIVEVIVPGQAKITRHLGHKPGDRQVPKWLAGQPGH